MAAFLDIRSTVKINGEPYVVRKIKDGNVVELQGIKNSITFDYTHKEFLCDLVTGKLDIADERDISGGTEAILISDLPDDLKSIVKYRLKWVQAIDAEKIKRSADKLQEFIAKKSSSDLAEGGKVPSASTLQKWCRAWINSDRNYFSLINNNKNRKRSLRLHKAKERLISEGIETIYYLSPAETAQDVCDWVNNALNAQKYKDMKAGKVSLSTIRRRIHALDEFDVMCRKFGRQFALKAFKARKSVHVPTRILQTIEIDETIIDVYVVDENGLPLGRPTLIFVVDFVDLHLILTH